ETLHQRKQKTPPDGHASLETPRENLISLEQNSAVQCLSVSMRLSVAIIAFFSAHTLYAQSTRKPEFDVATLKAEAPLAPGDNYRANLGSFANGKVTLTNVTLSDCIKFAYGIVSDSQIFGPEWIKS